MRVSDFVVCENIALRSGSVYMTTLYMAGVQLFILLLSEKFTAITTRASATTSAILKILK